MPGSKRIRRLLEAASALLLDSPTLRNAMHYDTLQGEFATVRLDSYVASARLRPGITSQDREGDFHSAGTSR